MEGKPVKVLGRLTKTDAHLREFGASPMTQPYGDLSSSSYTNLN